MNSLDWPHTFGLKSYILFLVILFSSCATESPEDLKDHELATKWADMTLYITQFTGANTPTYASRCLGYIGLTMYESIVHGSPDYQSVALELNNLMALPKPDLKEEYCWPIAFNAAQASIIKLIYGQTSDENKIKVDSLHDALLHILSHEISDRAIITRSESYGMSIAEAIFEWSKTDGGHRGYLNNFDKKWQHPVFEGSWQPPLFAQSFSHHPLHPYWGQNRTFLMVNSQLEVPDMFPYSRDPNSDYYQQYLSVYEKDKSLTQDEKEIALWWGDDPDQSFTPPGHSYYLATQTIKMSKPSLVQCAETYARVGMAVADAFINCWKWKYHHFTERPNTFIPINIDQEFESFWPDPPFPAFPSGHAINGAACATVLIDLYGDDIALIDSSHIHRERDRVRDVDFVPRRFNSIWAIAEEIANSRFYGGIHIPHDNNVGLDNGKIIAQNVNRLNWRKNKI